MTTNNTITEAIAAVDALATAAWNLVHIWQANTDGDIDLVLTATYPKRAMTMSFDEFAAELSEWRDQLLVDADNFVDDEVL